MTLEQENRFNNLKEIAIKYADTIKINLDNNFRSNPEYNIDSKKARDFIYDAIINIKNYIDNGNLKISNIPNDAIRIIKNKV